MAVWLQVTGVCREMRVGCLVLNCGLQCSKKRKRGRCWSQRQAENLSRHHVPSRQQVRTRSDFEVVGGKNNCRKCVAIVERQ
jgi:hypothetical protein